MPRGERWRYVEHPKCEGAALQVSNLGNVREASGQLLTVAHNREGYGFVRWRTEGGLRVSCCVHHLVAHAFLKPTGRSTKPTVRFRNGDRSDCRTRNLRWEVQGAIIRNRSLTDADVAEARRLASTTAVPEIAARFKVHRSTIYDLLGGETYRRVGTGQPKRA